jgi:CMP-N-acetylneuraminic acid synthetase
MKNKKSIIAVIPIKLKSDRVSSKNFREFINGKSLTDLLIQKLKDSKYISKIYISSNAIEYKKYFEDLGCEFLERNDKYCDNNLSWSDVIFEVVNSIPEDDTSHICWCHTTSPLFDNFDEAIKQYYKSIINNNYNGLITVIKSSDFIITEKKQPLNYAWGPWHKYSQNLDKIYKITGALFIAKKSQMLKNRYVISTNPKFYEVSPLEAVDVDTTFDFELAKILYNNKSELINA